VDQSSFVNSKPHLQGADRGSISENGDNEVFERMVDRVLSYPPKSARKKKRVAKKKAKKGKVHRGAFGD
jgi:hypothetical protein